MVGYGATGGNPLGLIFGMIPPALGAIFKKIGNWITRKEMDSIQDALLNKDMDSVEDIITKLYSKYEPAVRGASAALAASSSETTADIAESTLSDMISP